MNERILTDNGYAVLDARTGGYKYYYYVKDYQGNIRAVLDEENNVVESNSYYPYGMPYADNYEENNVVESNSYYPYGMPYADNYTSVQPYKYGGKELDRANGLDMYDFHARQYDPAFPCFTSIDELCEKYPSISPYAYCARNPILYVNYKGDSISLAPIQKLDQTLNSNFTQTILSDLNNITGLSLTVSSDSILT